MAILHSYSTTSTNNTTNNNTNDNKGNHLLFKNRLHITTSYVCAGDSFLVF